MSKLGFSALAFSLAGAGASFAPPAWADSAPPDAAVKEAEQRYDEGRQLFAQQRWADALLKFTQACAVHRTPNCARNLAATEVELGHDPEVVTHLREYFQQPDVPKDDPGIPRLREVLAATWKRTGHLRVQAPDGAVVKVDEVSKGKAPLGDPLDVTVGKHLVTATLTAGRVLTQSITAPAGATVDVTLSEPVALKPATRPSRMRIVIPAALGGAAVVSLIGGIYFAARSSHLDGEASALFPGQPASDTCLSPSAPGTCATLRDVRSSQSTDATLSTVFYVGAGALAGGALLTYFLWPHGRASSDAAWVAPHVGPSAAGVDVGGRF